MTTSPRPAYRRRVPPNTRITCAVFAPELSATLTIDSCWIIADYLARSTISTTRQRLSFDSGRVSAMRTVSPVFAEFASSCAFTFFVRVTILPYTGCATRRSIATTTVFCILSPTTRPTRVLRVARLWAPVTARLELIISAIGLCLLFSEHGLEARQIAANDAQTERILERLSRAPEAEAELLLFELLHARFDVLAPHLANFVSPHDEPPRARRTSCEWASSRPRGPSP